LETDALPVELLAYVVSGVGKVVVSPPRLIPELLGFAVQRMLAAARAKFLDLDAVGIVAPVFLCGVIAFLAITARQSNYWTDIFL
jgi:hypothetical protein